jgi:hypothetical protein
MLDASRACRVGGGPRLRRHRAAAACGARCFANPGRCQRPIWRCQAEPREAASSPQFGGSDSGSSSSSSSPGKGAAAPGAASGQTPRPSSAAAPSPNDPAAWAWASAVSRRVNLDLALTEAAGAALAACGPAEPDVAFVFASSAYGQTLDLLVPLLRRLLPTARAIVGCTGFGVLGTAIEGGLPEEVEHAPAVALALGALPGVEIKLRRVDEGGVPDGDAPPGEWADLVGLPLDGSSGTDTGGSSAGGGGGGEAASTNFIIISDPSFANIEELLAGLDFAFPDAKKIGGWWS